MDSQHRHELQENDLQAFIIRIRYYLATYWQQLIIALSLVVLLITAIQFVRSRSYRHHEDAWMELSTVSSPDAARAVAQTHDDPTVKVMAYLAGADLSLTRATSPNAMNLAGPEAPGKAPATVDPDIALKQAQEMYKAALSVPGVAPIFGLNARLGLASVAEARQDWAEASSQYQQVIKQAGTELPAITAQAQARLDLLDRVKKPVTLAPPEVAPVPTTAPAAESAPTTSPAP